MLLALASPVTLSVEALRARRAARRLARHPSTASSREGAPSAGASAALRGGPGIPGHDPHANYIRMGAAGGRQLAPQALLGAQAHAAAGAMREQAAGPMAWIR